MASTHCPLLSLPAELRNSIFSYALVSDHEITLKHRPANKAHTALFLTCKQIHQETVGVFYHGNHFMISSSADLRAWIKSIGVRQTSFLRTITFTHDCSDYLATTFARLATLAHLKNLNIRICMMSPVVHCTKQPQKEVSTDRAMADPLFGALVILRNIENLTMEMSQTRQSRSVVLKNRVRNIESWVRGFVMQPEAASDGVTMLQIVRWHLRNEREGARLWGTS